MAQVAESLSDGVIGDNELRRCEKELSEHIAAAYRLQLLPPAPGAPDFPAPPDRCRARRRRGGLPAAVA
jgi:hypothetical protein